MLRKFKKGSYKALKRCVVCAGYLLLLLYPTHVNPPPPSTRLGPSNKLSKIARAMQQHRVGTTLAHSVGSSVRCAAVYKSQVWTGSREGAVIIRDLHTCEELHRVEIPAETFVWSLMCIEDRMWVGTQSGVVLVFNAKNRCVRGIVTNRKQHALCVCVLTAHCAAACCCCCFSRVLLGNYCGRSSSTQAACTAW